MALGAEFFRSSIVPATPALGRGVARSSDYDPGAFLARLRNQVRPYDAVPVVLGKHRVVPPLAPGAVGGTGGGPPRPAVGGGARRGATTTVTLTVCWGYGPLRVSAIRIGDVPIATFADVSIATTEGRDANAPPVLIASPLAISTITIRATDQLLDYVDTLSGVVESEGPVWTGSAWTRGWTRNPASMARLLLQGPARRRPAPDDALDLDAWAAFHAHCAAEGFSFDAVVETRRSVWSLLQAICAAGRGAPVRRRGRWSVVVDDGRQPITERYTAVNVANFRADTSLAPPPHAVRTSFANADRDWLRDQRVVYADGYDASTATEILDVTADGLTDPGQVWRDARYRLAQARARRTRWSCDVGPEFLLAARGARVLVQHGIAGAGLASARIVATTRDAQGRITDVEVDAPIRFAEPVTYAARVRTIDVADLTFALSVVGGEDLPPRTMLPLASPLAANVAAGDLISIGPTGDVARDGIILEVRPGQALGARLTLAPFDAKVYAAETPPAFVSRLGTARSRLVMTISSATSGDDLLVLIGNVYAPGLRLVVRPAADPRARIDAEIRRHGATAWAGATARRQARDGIELGGVEAGAAYDVRLRWTIARTELPERVPSHDVSPLPSDWAMLSNHTITANPPPPAPSDLLVTEQIGNIRAISWTPPDVPDLAGVRLRVTTDMSETDWDAMTPIERGVLTASPHLSTEPAAAGTFRFAARAVDTARKESPVIMRDVALKAVAEGLDGAPGRRGLTGFASRISRSQRADSVAALTATHWYLSGTVGSWTGAQDLVIVVSARDEEILALIDAGALVTLYRDTENWADYTLSGKVAFSDGSNNRRLATLRLVHLESEGASPASGEIEIRFTPAGATGIAGARWFFGSNAPPSGLGKDGDFYLRTTTAVVYSKSAGAWTQVAHLRGADAATWHSGSGTPASTLGKVGDYYFRTSNATIWRKTPSGWVQLIDIDGADGATWHSGSGTPASTLGKVGDYYFRTSNGFVYEKTAARTWTYRADITGPQGPPGTPAPPLPRLSKILWSTTTYHQISASGSWLVMNESIASYDALLLLGLGRDRSNWGSASRYVSARAIPDYLSNTVNSDYGRYAQGNWTVLQVNVLGSRNVNRDVNLFLASAFSGTQLYIREPNWNFRLQRIIGFKSQI